VHQSTPGLSHFICHPLARSQPAAVGDPSASYIVICVPILCVPSVSTGNLATHPVPGTISQSTSLSPQRSLSPSQQCAMRQVVGLQLPVKPEFQELVQHHGMCADSCVASHLVEPWQCTVMGPAALARCVSCSQPPSSARQPQSRVSFIAHFIHSMPTHSC
jgi:hypothetical protein